MPRNGFRACRTQKQIARVYWGFRSFRRPWGREWGRQPTGSLAVCDSTRPKVLNATRDVRETDDLGIAGEENEIVSGGSRDGKAVAER